MAKKYRKIYLQPLTFRWAQIKTKIITLIRMSLKILEYKFW